MIPATTDDVTRVQAQASSVATRPGTLDWARGLARELADHPDRGADRWAREYLRALGWPPADGPRVWRRRPAEPGEHPAPYLKNGRDVHRLNLLHDLEAANITPAPYAVEVHAADPDEHAEAAPRWPWVAPFLSVQPVAVPQGRRARV